jgi:uncharacterized protein (DUF58 family)
MMPVPSARHSEVVEASADVVRRLRPTSPVPLAVLGLLVFLQLVSPASAWSWSLVALGSLLALSYLWARVLRDRVAATRTVLGTWVVAGDELGERFTLTNRSILPAVWVRVVDHSAVPGYSAGRVETVDGNTERTWVYRGTCRRRGVFRLGPWDLQTGDPFGFFTVTQHYPTFSTVMVYPRPSYLPDLELPRGGASGRARSAERAAAETITPAEIRDYRPGDSLRRVHWPSSAHHDRLLVREFDREPTGDVWLVLDMNAAAQAGHDAEATQEYGVILAASLAAQLLRGGERRAVGLLVSGRRPAWIAPGRGPAQEWQILEALAEAEPGSERSLAALLEDLGSSLGSGRTLVLITPSQDIAWVGALLPLAARGNAPAVLLLDATTFDPPCGSAEALAGLRGLLARQRVTTYVLAQGFPFKPVDRIRRHRTVLRTLSATGRVIAVDVEEEV